MKRIIATVLFASLAAMAVKAPAASLKVNGNPAPLIAITVSAGLDPDPVYDSSTSYDLNINMAMQKITGALDAAMPPYTALRITLAAPVSAVSTGQVLLLTTPQDLVTGITGHVKEKGMTISYEFTATAAAGVIPPSTRTVTFTLTDN